MGQEKLLEIILDCNKPVTKTFLMKKYPFCKQSFFRSLTRLCNKGCIIKIENFEDRRMYYYKNNE